jgi:hypothetical protein
MVDDHRLAGMRAMPRALYNQQLGPGQLGDPLAPRQRAAAVLVSVDREHRAANATQQPFGMLGPDTADGASSRASSVSGLVSMAQLTASSRGLVECGSENSSPKKNSA